MVAIRIQIAHSNAVYWLGKLSVVVGIALAYVTLALTSSIAAQVQVPDKDVSAHKAGALDQLEQVVHDAFRDTHDGWSSDEMLIRDELNQAFIKRCREKLPDASEQELNWTLLNLRKAGKLGIKATQSNNESYDDVEHLAEIAARSVQDKYQISTDAIMADPKYKSEFDAIALGIDPSLETYQVRKCALRLRKARQLRPELITRIADWNREVEEFSAAEVAIDLGLIPEKPGIYLFRDKTGYLYVGEAINLRQRLKTHLEESDRISLARYLKQQGADSISIEIHSFPTDSRMKDITVRRAYESELIRSREPRFNVRP